MKIMQISSFVLALTAGANAHTLFSKLYVNGQDQGNGTCIRQPSNPDTATFPVGDLASTDMACGFNGTTGVAHVCAVPDKSTLTFEYREWPDDASKGSIDVSHKGPCAVYLKKVDSAISDAGAGDGWFKIWDEGYDEAAGKWCTEKLITNNGHLSVAIPQGLQGGYYLVRPELLALHQADKIPSDPQFYPGCAQVYLESSGTSLPENTVEIPGYVEAGQPPVSFDIWTVPMALPYPMPGPDPYTPSSRTASKSVAQNTLAQTEGLWPAHCVLYNANWCGVELNEYNTDTGCWNASKACWAQCTTCYNEAPPTGSLNCPIWEAKCTAIDNACNALIYNGPPNYMKQLTPAVQSVSLPGIVAAQTGDGSYDLASASSVDSTTTTTSYTLAISPVSTASASTSPALSSYLATASASEVPATSANAADLSISTDGACGTGVTCQGSTFGNCCSSHGWCGQSSDYCDAGCNSQFGSCGATVKSRKAASDFGISDHRAQLKRSFERSSVLEEAQTPDSADHLLNHADTHLDRRQTISTNGNCGNGVTCEGSAFGNCCSQYNQCGSTIGFCGYGCQFSFGQCDIGINGRRSNHRSNTAKHHGHRHKATIANAGVNDFVTN
ncbi:hypothetical protein MBLNU459_g1915t1 [Dothideomycetes sp. NU459]